LAPTRCSYRSRVIRSSPTSSSISRCITILITLAIVGVGLKLEQIRIALAVGSEAFRNIVLKEVGNKLVGL
jgi:hypothetical protein